MIYQWYSGSDSSNEVPRRLSKLDSGTLDTPAEVAIAILRDLLPVEQDPNWRGYLLWRIGRAHLSEDREDEGIAAVLEASKEFDPLLRTINDVMAAYCDVLYCLILGYYSQHEDLEAVAQLGLWIVCNMAETRFDDAQKAAVFSQLGFAFNQLAKKHSLDWMRSMALASYLGWHRVAPEDERCLERLIYCYYNAGDLKRCSAVVEMIREVARTGEIRDQVEKFVRDHSQELVRKGP